MAGDWLKFDKATPEKPEVFAIAAETGLDPDAVVGKLIRVWSWFDTHTETGNARSVTSALLDRIAGVTGFVTAMQNCGWATIENGGCSLPNFDRHCGKTAKTRALGAIRTNASRMRNDASVTESLPEKRREEKSTEEKKDQKKKRAEKKQNDEFPSLPDWIPSDAWDGYAAMRQKIRKPMTPYAAKLIINALSKLMDSGHAPSSVLDQSIRNNWTDVYAVKPTGSNHANIQTSGRLSLADQSLQRINQREAAPVVIDSRPVLDADAGPIRPRLVEPVRNGG